MSEFTERALARMAALGKTVVVVGTDPAYADTTVYSLVHPDGRVEVIPGRPLTAGSSSTLPPMPTIDEWGDVWSPAAARAYRPPRVSRPRPIPEDELRRTIKRTRIRYAANRARAITKRTRK